MNPIDKFTNIDAVYPITDAYSKLMFKLLHLFPYLVVPTNVK